VEGGQDGGGGGGVFSGWIGVRRSHLEGPGCWVACWVSFGEGGVGGSLGGGWGLSMAGCCGWGLGVRVRVGLCFCARSVLSRGGFAVEVGVHAFEGQEM